MEQGSRSLIDLNRCGVGLMEIVFAPDLYDGEQAVGLVRELSLILRSVGSCSCAMEDGALRVDANISVMPSDSDQLGVRTEVKNINSLRNVQGAIEAEVDRQVRSIPIAMPLLLLQLLQNSVYKVAVCILQLRHR